MVSALYPAGTRHYDKVAGMARQSVSYLSFDLPGIPYPYTHSTTFCNGQTDGGMEFPMMTNNGAPASLAGTAGLTFHEIAHTYFPFYMGINERKYAWMDEGWATFFPADVVDRYDNTYDYEAHVVMSYLSQACTEFNVPLMVNSAMLNSPAYRGASYYRSAMAYKFLQDAFGQELFLRALQEFIHQWNGKHPQPADFFNIFKAKAGKDLDWFLDPWFYEIKCPDLGIGDIKKSGKFVSIVIENRGGLPLPVHLKILNMDGSTQDFFSTCAIWEDENTRKTIKIRTEGRPVKVTLGDAHIPDIQPSDNVKIIP
jgi:aminopeptidase N